MCCDWLIARKANIQSSVCARVRDGDVDDAIDDSVEHSYLDSVESVVFKCVPF